MLDRHLLEQVGVVDIVWLGEVPDRFRGRPATDVVAIMFLFVSQWQLLSSSFANNRPLAVSYVCLHDII